MNKADTNWGWIKGTEIKFPSTMNMYVSTPTTWCLSVVITRPSCTQFMTSTIVRSISRLSYCTLSLIYTLAGILKSSETQSLRRLWVVTYQSTTMFRMLPRTFRKCSWAKVERKISTFSRIPHRAWQFTITWPGKYQLLSGAHRCPMLVGRYWQGRCRSRDITTINIPGPDKNRTFRTCV